MLDLIIAISFVSIIFGGIAIIYGGFMVLISPIMFAIYKLDGGKWSFRKWFKWWMKSL